jgi:predicted RNA binding protein YcfA (HicA-like mRNA interferase family)
MGKMGDDLKRILKNAGFIFYRPCKGDHEIWVHPQKRISVTVDSGVASRHTANAVLKKAGLPKAF